MRFCLSILLIFFTFSIKVRGYDIESNYIEGLRYFHQQQYNVSAHLFKKILQKNKFSLRNFNANYYLILSNLHLKKLKSKQNIIDFATKYKNHYRASDAWYHLANTYFSDQDYNSALNYYYKINYSHLAISHKDELNYRYGYSYLNLKEFKLANKYFTKIRKKPNDYKYLANYYSGYILLCENKFNKALKCFKTAQQNVDFESIIPYMISQTFYRQKLYEKTLNYLKGIEDKKIIINNEDDIELMKAESNRMLENFHIASKQYENYSFYNDSEAIDREIDIRNAYTLYKNNKIEKAFKKLIKLSNSNDHISKQAFYLIGKIYLLKNKKQEALTTFERAYDNINKWKDEEILYLYSKLHYDIGNIKKSVVLMREFKQKFSKSVYINEINTLLGNFYLKTNNYNIIVEEIEAIPNKNEKIYEIYQKGTFYKGCECFNSGNYNESIELFKKSIEKGVNEELKILTKIYLSDTYFIVEENENAKKNYLYLLNYYTKINKQNLFKIYYGLAYVEFKDKNYKTALEYFHKILPLYKKTDLKSYYKEDFEYNIIIRIADSYYYLNEYAKSLENYNKFLVRYPNSLHAIYQKGILFSLMNKKSEAEKCFSIVLLKTKNNNLYYYDNAYYNNIILLINYEEYEKAKNEINKYLRERKNSKFAHNFLSKLAICYINLNEKDNALEAYKKLINDYTNTNEAHQALLELQKIADDKTFDEYLTVYKRSLTDKKSLENIEYESGRTYFFYKKYQKAILSLKEYLKAYPQGKKINEAKFLIAQSLRKLSLYKESIQYLEELITNKEDIYFYKALLQICSLNYELENYEEALKYYEILSVYSKIKKDKIISLQGIMRSAFNIDKLQLAFINAQKILETTNRPTFILEAKLYIGKIYKNKNNEEKSLKILEEIKQQNGGIYSAEALYVTSIIYFNKKNYDESLNQLFHLTKKYSKYTTISEKAFLLIGENYIMQKEYFQALETFKSIKKESKDSTIINQAIERIKFIENTLLKNLEQKEKKQLEETHKDKLKTKKIIKKKKDEFYTLK